MKQWLLNDGKTEAIDVEEKYVRWSEELRSDKYKTATRTSNLNYMISYNVTYGKATIQTAGYHTNPHMYHPIPYHSIVSLFSRQTGS